MSEECQRRKIGASVLDIGPVGEVAVTEMVKSIGKDCLESRVASYESRAMLASTNS